MQFLEAVRLALQSLWANKLRSILTLLGVIIGVGSVITVVTLTNGAKQFVTSKINSYGAATITISKMPQTFITIEEWLSFQKRKDVTYDDYRAVLTDCRLCQSVGAQRHGSGKVVRGSKSSTDTDIRGWTWTMPALSNLNIDLGRSFTQVEDDHSAAVAIVGADIVDKLLGDGDPLGKEIRVDGTLYTVIGVGERQGKMLGMSLDNWVAIPLMSFLKRYGAHYSLSIYVDAGAGGEVMDMAADELRTIMRARRHLAPNAPDAFSIDSSATFQNLLGKIINNFGAVVAAIATISLVIGGIVIMNIMLVSVTERTREIGVRKALGATRRNIMLQFLIESVVLSLLGGIIGILMGGGSAILFRALLHWNTSVAPSSIMLAFLFSAAVGIAFGVWPARRAASLDPITALRYE
jgi:putative ABC transport system permease protein